VIGYYAHHHGLGHLTRLQGIAEHLRTPITGLSTLPAPKGWHQPWIRLERDDRMPPARVATSDPTAHGVLHWVPRHDAGLAGRAVQVASWIERTRPALVVVDVSVEVSVLVRLCGVPVVVIAMPGARTDRAHRIAYDLADALLAPWPSGAHTSGWPDTWVDKLWTVGGFSRFDGRTPARLDEVTPGRVPGSATARGARTGGMGPRSGSSPRRRVLLLWGGGGRRTSTADVAAARAATPDWDWVERGPESPSTDLWADLAAADVVVTHAGQNAVAEVAAARRPAVVVPQPRPFDEQGATASAVERLGVAVGLRSWPSDAGTWPALLDRAAARGGAGWERWSSGNGAAHAARLLDSLAARLTAPADSVASVAS
jgi:hypothetical protein